MMKYMMLSSMMKGKENGGMGSLLPLMLMGGRGGMTDDLFDFDGFDMDAADDEEEA